MSNNTLFIVSAPSGSGKTVIMRSIMNNELVSFTTRAMREKEVDGRDYIFITKEKFEELLNSNGLMEYTDYYGTNYYGLTRQEFETKISKSHCFFVADYEGYKQMKEKYDHVVSIFIYCTKDDCERNMRSRGDSEENIQKRLSTYEIEIENMHKYDHVVTNNYGELDYTIEKVKDIIEMEIGNE